MHRNGLVNTIFAGCISATRWGPLGCWRRRGASCPHLNVMQTVDLVFHARSVASRPLGGLGGHTAQQLQAGSAVAMWLCTNPTRSRIMPSSKCTADCRLGFFMRDQLPQGP